MIYQNFRCNFDPYAYHYVGVLTSIAKLFGSNELDSDVNCQYFGLNIFYFIYMKRDWAEHRCYVEALSHTVNFLNLLNHTYTNQLGL